MNILADFPDLELSFSRYTFLLLMAPPVERSDDEAITEPIAANGLPEQLPETVEVEAQLPKVYSKQSERLVKQSWEILKKDAQRNGINFFRKVIEIAPEAKAQFSLLQDSTVPFEQNPKTGDAAVQLGEKGAYQAFGTGLQKVAAKHIIRGVVDNQFEVIKQSILCAIQMGVPDLWSAELKSAWGDAYDILAAAVIAETHAQLAKVDQTT